MAGDRGLARWRIDNNEACPNDAYRLSASQHAPLARLGELLDFPLVTWLRDTAPTLTGAWAVLIVGIVTAAASVSAYWRNAAEARKSEQRETLSRAIADVIAWKELPYRVARRLDDEPETKRDLIRAFHEVQERLDYDQVWVRLFDTRVAECFDTLLDDVKKRSAQHIKDAWTGGPKAASFLNGQYTVDTKASEAALVEAIRRKV